MSENPIPGLSAEANIFAKHPDGFGVHIKVVCENGSKIVSNLSVTIAALLEKGYTPDARPGPSEPASRSYGTGGGNGQGNANNSRQPRQEMFDVVCDDCHRNTKVPFPPKGDRPVYCRDCYSRNRQPARQRY